MQLKRIPASSTRALALTAALWTVACGTSEPPGTAAHERHVIEREAATRARIDIDMSAGELAVKSGATALFEGDFDFNIPSVRPVVAYAVNGAVGELKVSQESASGNDENHWRVRLDETTPVDLQISLKAGDAQLALGSLDLEGLAINRGAGDLVVDLRGKPARSYTVIVTAGAGDTTIHLPSSVGISARTSGLIGDVTVNGLEERDGRWVNVLAEKSAVTIDLQVQHSIGDLRLLAD